MTYKTNFLHGSTDEADEIRAYDELCNYLIRDGKYANTVEVDDDAGERLEYFDGLGLYDDDSQLINASIYRKKTHALIYAHNLHDVIVKNNGFLPDFGLNEKLEATDPFEKIYDLISNELSDEASKKDVIEKLGQCGIEADKAESVADSIISSEKNIVARKCMIQYISYSILGFAIFFACLVFFLDESTLTNIAKYAAFIALSLIPLVGFLTDYDGKIFAYIRFGALNILWFSIGLLSGLLFMQDVWLLSTVHTGGTAIAMIFVSIINVVIHVVNLLGPIGFGVIFGVVSFVSLITAWSESDKIKNEIFKGES